MFANLSVLAVSLALIASGQSPILINIALSLWSFALTLQLIPSLSSLFVDAGLFGIDLNKLSKNKVPEALGVICGAVYLICLFLFIPVPFLGKLLDTSDDFPFPHNQFVEFICALLSICCMIFLGFADDVLNLRWRHKLVLPTMATLPLLMVYYANGGSTFVMVPKPFRGLLGLSVDLGPLYYLYMGMLAVFCTNAINILAGINGIEAGQSFVIAVSIAANNVLQIVYRMESWQHHEFSLYLILPLIGTTGALLWFNWYPSRVFVGDTFCYFAGMTFAVVGILGHFSKTMLLFFIPQILNFVYSLPQLFHFVPCPRHRMPKFNPETGLIGMSYTHFKYSELKPAVRVMVKTFKALRLVSVTELTQAEYDREVQSGKPTEKAESGSAGAGASASRTAVSTRSRTKKQDTGSDSSSDSSSEPIVRMNNMTIINFVIKVIGPHTEAQVTTAVLLFQVFCSCVAFFVRYQLVKLVYDS